MFRIRLDGTAIQKSWESLANIPPSATKLIVVLGFLTLCALVLSEGVSTRQFLLVTLIAFLPIGIYLATKYPVIFPFTLYVTLVPLNDVLASHEFGTLARVAGAASFLVLALWLVHKRTIVKPPLTGFAWLALTVWITMGGMWALNRDDWAAGLATFLQCFCLYAILTVVPVRASDWNAILLAVIAGGVIAAGLGIYASFHASTFYGNRTWIVSTSGDVVGPNHLAGALLLPVFVTASATLSERRWLSKLASVLCLCILMAGIYLTGSRDAVLAVAAGFLYLIMRTRYRAQLSFLLIAVALVAVPYFSDLASRFSLITSDSGAGRLFIWQIGWLAFKKYWLLGAGFQNFAHAFDQAYLQVYSRVPTGWGYDGHNLFLTSAVEFGIFGLLVLVICWVTQFFMLRQIGRSSAFYDSRIALEASLLALFVSSIFVNRILIEKYAWLIFSVMVLLKSRYLVSLHENASFRNGISDQPPARSRLNGHPKPIFRRDVTHKVPLP
jgi:O-antigen ligase